MTGKLNGGREATEVSDTMAAWERFLTGDPTAKIPDRNFVVASWLRSQVLGVNPTGRTAPIAARGDAMVQLRHRSSELMEASAGVFAELAETFSGSRTIMLLTNPDGIVLDAVGDSRTLDQGQRIHLTLGGDWREDVVGTNGIGTALATGRPAQVHAAEHFCEGIKAWTCAGAPVFEPGTGEMLGVIDISGPPSTYQRGNLTLAVLAARQIEMHLADRASAERMKLLEICLARISEKDVAGMVAIDRSGRLVHRTGRVPGLVALGQRVQGLGADIAVHDWAERLPEGLRAEWLNPVMIDGRAIGAVLVVPTRPFAASSVLSPPPVPTRPDGFDLIVGNSACLADVKLRALHLVGKQVPVLIEGETGVGKELFARAIHGGDIPGKPFVVFNCGAVARDLIASELFGHVRGAFTGAANEGRPGRFEQANGGTLCLDEIGELPLDLQPYLLRALEEGAITRLGDTQPRRVNVRLLTMTNRKLLDEVAAGRFRRDLYHRIGVTCIRPPPLRERVGDVGLLVDHFNALLAERHSVPMRHFGIDAMQLLSAYHWPGNVRELRNVVESLLLMSDTTDVRLDELASGHLIQAIAVSGALSVDLQPGSTPTTCLADVERAAVIAAMGRYKGNVAAAARSLGVSRSTMYRRIDQYGLLT